MHEGVSLQFLDPLLTVGLCLFVWGVYLLLLLMQHVRVNLHFLTPVCGNSAKKTTNVRFGAEVLQNSKMCFPCSVAPI